MYENDNFNFIDTCTNDRRLTVAVHVDFFVIKENENVLII